MLSTLTPQFSFWLTSMATCLATRSQLGGGSEPQLSKGTEAEVKEVEAVVISTEVMDSSTEPGMPLPKYCSVATTLGVPARAGTAPPWDLSFTCPFALQAPWPTWHDPLTRCASYQPCLHFADPTWQGPGWLGRAGDAADTWVLAKREPDGFYYRARIKTAPELERQGALLVEFEAPLIMGLELPAQRQSVVLGEDVIQFLPSSEYSLQPGDKVLAPWEPSRQRYGPATVLGLESRGPQRVSEDIAVCFWNGKTATVPLGGVAWVPPAVWKKAVESLPGPFTRKHSGALLRPSCCSLLAPVTSCMISGLPLGTPVLYPPFHAHACCQLLCQGCLDCCPVAGATWWPLTRTSGVTTRERPEAELKPTAQLLPLKAPKEEEGALQAPVAVSSSSSSEEDLEKDLELGLPQRLMVDGTVNTDPIFVEKTPRREGGFCQPEWRYWKRNGPEPHPGKPGKRCCNIQKEKGKKQQREQTVVVRGDIKELVLEGSSMKPLQILSKKADHRKLGTTLDI